MSVCLIIDDVIDVANTFQLTTPISRRLLEEMLLLKSLVLSLSMERSNETTRIMRKFEQNKDWTDFWEIRNWNDVCEMMEGTAYIMRSNWDI